MEEFKAKILAKIAEHKQQVRIWQGLQREADFADKGYCSGQGSLYQGRINELEWILELVADIKPTLGQFTEAEVRDGLRLRDIPH
jgi:capsule polysaccharide export protein KpsE/RkpR